MMAYLTLQGLAIVLLVDFAIASVQNEKTTIRSVAETAGLWRDQPAFSEVHDPKSKASEE